MSHAVPSPPPPHTTVQQGWQTDPRVGGPQAEPGKGVPRAVGLRGGAAALLPTPGQHPESQLRAPSTPAAPPHTLSLSSPHHQPGKVPAAVQATCFQAKPSPSPVFVLPPRDLLCNQSETLLEPEAKKVWEKAQSSFPSALLLSTPSQHALSKAQQDRHTQDRRWLSSVPWLRRSQPTAVARPRESSRSAKGATTRWPFPGSLLNSISCVPTALRRVGPCPLGEPDSPQACSRRHKPGSSSSLPSNHTKLAETQKRGHPRRNRRPRQPGGAMSRSP